MVEQTGDIWQYYCILGHTICLTTNGFVKKNGQAVMGRGNALEATQRIPRIATLLGSYIKKSGNVAGMMAVNELYMYNEAVYIFPVKHNWFEPADMKLIQNSAARLDEYARTECGTVFHLPRPGCGNGRLKWADVKPYLEFLPDNVVVHDKIGEM